MWVVIPAFNSSIVCGNCLKILKLVSLHSYFWDLMHSVVWLNKIALAMKVSTSFARNLIVVLFKPVTWSFIIGLPKKHYQFRNEANINWSDILYCKLIYDLLHMANHSISWGVANDNRARVKFDWITHQFLHLGLFLCVVWCVAMRPLLERRSTDGLRQLWCRCDDTSWRSHWNCSTAELLRPRVEGARRSRAVLL